MTELGPGICTSSESPRRTPVAARRHRRSKADVRGQRVDEGRREAGSGIGGCGCVAVAPPWRSHRGSPPPDCARALSERRTTGLPLHRLESITQLGVAMEGAYVFRSPKLTALCRSTKRVWFLLRRGQFHLSLTTQASARLSTGVSTLRGTPGELLGAGRATMGAGRTRLGFRLASPLPRLPQTTVERYKSSIQLSPSTYLLPKSG
jgi:hypothetical protein